MSEEAALAAAILEQPSDDVCPSIYADWLEDRGDVRAAWLRLALEIRSLARKAKIPPFDLGDTHVARSRLQRLGNPLGVDLASLWACSCVRFLPLPDGRIFTAVLSLALRRWLSNIELKACGLPSAEQVCPDLFYTRSDVVVDNLSRDVVSFVLGIGSLLLNDGGDLAFLMAGSPWEIADSRQRNAVARRQIKQARKWCFGLARRIFKLPSLAVAARKTAPFSPGDGARGWRGRGSR
jgi:uncharacterized protein (TIGR02996 family)